MKRVLVLVLALAAVGAAKSVVLTLDAPCNNVCGLGWEDGKLWAVDEVSDMVYQLDPTNGDILSSFDASISSSYDATGLAVENGYVYVGAWNGYTSAYVYKFNESGGYLGATYMCGG
ncbi:hypothetical protein GF402_04285 [Candidatus Fermentibacteria bacterium]|nr:hypothetical protein [Candidatus Fermentibacteria bacterium]